MKEFMKNLSTEGGKTVVECIRLIEVSEAYAEEIRAFRQEVLSCDKDSGDRFAGCLSLDVCAEITEWIRLCKLRTKEETCASTGAAVPSYTYLAIRISDNRLIGMIDLRLHIRHPYLSMYGGHCGYTVRPCERGLGYAKEMLALNKQNAKRFGIRQLLLTCNVSNSASEAVILANGGVFEKTIEADGHAIKRYWISVD